MAHEAGPRARGRAWRFLVPAVFVAAGLLATTSAQTARGTDLRSAGRTDLADVIQSEQHRADTSAVEVQRLRSEVERLTSEAGSSEGDGAVAAADARLRQLGQVAGTVPVRGPGLTVTLNDSPLKTPPDGFTADDLVVHQQDLQAVVNALWAAGADAMMLMDQRVISTSAVRCVGNVLVLQDRVYSPPYRITAIGDTTRLRAALEGSRQVQIYREYVDAVGLGYDVRTRPSVTLPGYDDPLDLSHVTAGTGATSPTGSPTSSGSATPTTPAGSAS